MTPHDPSNPYVSPTEAAWSPVAKAFSENGVNAELVTVIESNRPELSDYQSNTALKASKQVQLTARELADRVARRLKTDADNIISSMTVDGPGFLNITLSNDYIASACNNIWSLAQLGCAPSANIKVILDFGGPNVAKSMHVGHLRSTIIGASLYAIFKWAGATVVSDVHLGDWGTQMGMLIHELSLRQPALCYFDESYTGPYPDKAPISLNELEVMYPEAAERCRSDELHMNAARAATAQLQAGRPGYRALWSHFVALSTSSLQDDFAFLGVKFDLWWGESTVYDRIDELVERLETAKIAELSDGAIVVRVAAPDDKVHIPPLLLRKADGAVMYGTTDLATIDVRRRDLHADKILYVVDQRQAMHFEQVFRAASRGGICPLESLEHIGFGTVNGPDGRPFKTRAGGVMKLKDLLVSAEEKARDRLNTDGKGPERLARDPDLPRKIGNAALKFADLSNYRLSNYNFDIEKFVNFEGKTGPYLLYSIVRIKSIVEKASERDLESFHVIPAESKEERELQLLLIRFSESFKRTLNERAPNVICEYGFNLAQTYSRFYSKHHIISEPDARLRQSRLSLCRLTSRVLETIMSLLAIEVVSAM